MSGVGAKRGLCPYQLPGTRLEHHSDRALISHGDRGPVLSLNESAAAVWELCDGDTTIDEMVMAICEVASIRPDHARDDVETTLAQLERAGLLAFNSGRSNKPSQRSRSRRGGPPREPRTA